jgi:hypothetical protein
MTHRLVHIVWCSIAHVGVLGKCISHLTTRHAVLAQSVIYHLLRVHKTYNFVVHTKFLANHTLTRFVGLFNFLLFSSHQMHCLLLQVPLHFQMHTKRLFLRRWRRLWRQIGWTWQLLWVDENSHFYTFGRSCVFSEPQAASRLTVWCIKTRAHILLRSRTRGSLLRSPATVSMCIGLLSSYHITLICRKFVVELLQICCRLVVELVVTLRICQRHLETPKCCRQISQWHFAVNLL